MLLFFLLSFSIKNDIKKFKLMCMVGFVVSNSLCDVEVA